MRQIVYGEQKLVADWVAERIGCPQWTPPGFEAIGVADARGDLVGGVVIDGFVPNTRCSLHGAGLNRTWLTRQFMHEVFYYIFEQLKCNVIVNPVSSANADSLRFTRHLGFSEVARIEKGCPDGDLVLFKMSRADCQWLEKRYEHKKAA